MKRFLLAVALAAMSGCGTEHSIGFVLAPGESAHARVLGERPRLEVEAQSGPVHVDIRQRELPAESLDVLGVVSRELRGDTDVDLLNKGEATSIVQVRVFGATGLTAEKGRR